MIIIQTFLPSESFEESAKWLDDRRLNKQILEAKTIYDIVSGKNTNSRWANHTATNLWKGYSEALALYYNSCLHEWKEVRHKNHSYKEILIDVNIHVWMPPWLGDVRLHSSHRCNLLRKDFEFYSKYGWQENLIKYETAPYWWGEEYGYGKVPNEIVSEKGEKKREVKIRETKLFIKKVFKIMKKSDK